MCVVSMVTEYYSDKWGRYYPNGAPTTGTWPPVWPQPWATQPSRSPSAAEVAEFRELLDRARAYDAKNSEPDCELAEKKVKLVKLVKELGLDDDLIEDIQEALDAKAS